jgi:hypothetical protein
MLQLLSNDTNWKKQNGHMQSMPLGTSAGKTVRAMGIATCLLLAPAAGWMALSGRRPQEDLPQAIRLDGPALRKSEPRVRCVNQTGMPACPLAIRPAAPIRAELAICLIIRDDADFPEWLTYHRRLGVGAFYVFDHNSTLPLPQRMPSAGPGLDHGDVHYEYVNQFNDPTDTCPQMAVYHHCLQIGRHHPWMAFIDVDEYLVPSSGHLYLPDFLRRFSGQCALTLNWRMLGAANHTDRPQGGVLENYTRCVPRNNYLDWWTKVIASPQYMIDFETVGTTDNQGPHRVSCRNSTYMVTEYGDRYGAPNVVPVQMDKLALFHFATRSLADYQDRMHRGASSGDTRNMTFFEEVDSQSSEDCFEARDLARSLGPGIGA